MTQEEFNDIRAAYPGAKLFYSAETAVYTYREIIGERTKVVTESARVLLAILTAIEKSPCPIGCPDCEEEHG